MFAIALRFCAFVGILLCSNLAVAENMTGGDLPEQGFSYFMGLGQIQTRYQESPSILPVKSTVKSSSLILISGALYALNRDFLFSMDNLTTFYPGTSTESWNATGPTFNGVNLTSPLLQQNSFSLSQSSTQLLLHYRVKGQWFVIGGPSFVSHSFKRYSFVIGPDKAVSTPSSTTVEESSNEVLLNMGVELESEQVLNQPDHYGLRLSVGLPVWRRLQNTSVPQYNFTSARGYDLSLDGRYSWAIRKDVQIGAWGRLSTSYRGNQTIGTTIEMPSSRLDSLGYGLELLWKL